MTTTDYAGNYIYENSTLKYFGHAEGYIENNNGIFSYFYQLKDHLGNIRVSYQDINQNNTSSVSLQIEEENNYYPFGLTHKGYNNLQSGYPFKYNGKELNEDLDLNWYDYGARNYDPALGRWQVLDAFAEKVPEMTPYRYAFNNPISVIDPDGNMESEIYDIGGGSITLYGKKGEVLFSMSSGASEKVSEVNGVHVARYEDGTIRVLTDEEYNKLIEGGVKEESSDGSVQDPVRPAKIDYSQSTLQILNSFISWFYFIDNNSDVILYPEDIIDWETISSRGFSSSKNWTMGGSATKKTYSDSGGEARLVIVEQLENFRKNRSHMAIQTYVEYLEGTTNPRRYHYQLIMQDGTTMINMYIKGKNLKNRIVSAVENNGWFMINNLKN